MEYIWKVSSRMSSIISIICRRICFPNWSSSWWTSFCNFYSLWIKYLQLCNL